MSRLGQVLRRATSSPEQSYCPDRGDIIELNFDPHEGREQAGKRPALVLSIRSYNERVRLCVLCPMTNQIKGYPFEVAVPADDEMGGGAVLPDQVKSLSWEARKSAFRGRATKAVMDEVGAKIKSLLSL
jgi:mRNA interferase MazF